MSEFNPRTKGEQVYKQDEAKQCPACGQVIQPPIKLVSNVMTHYHSKQTGRTIILNSEEASHTIGGVKFEKGVLPTTPIQQEQPLTPVVPAKPVVLTPSATPKVVAP